MAWCRPALAALSAIGYAIGHGVAGAAIGVLIWAALFAAPRLVLTSTLRQFRGADARMDMESCSKVQPVGHGDDVPDAVT